MQPSAKLSWSLDFSSAKASSLLIADTSAVLKRIRITHNEYSTTTMDPLSITSGVVGILAFAIQMAQMASKVKDAMAQFRTASAEADELFQRLAMLDTVCALVQQNLTRRHASSEAIPPSMLTAVSGALLQCHKKMEGLDKTLSAMSSTKPSKVRSWSSKSEALSRARFVFSRDKIRSMVQDVGDAMSLLQFIINVDMW